MNENETRLKLEIISNIKKNIETKINFLTFISGFLFTFLILTNVWLYKENYYIKYAFIINMSIFLIFIVLFFIYQKFVNKLHNANLILLLFVITDRKVIINKVEKFIEDNK